MNGESQSRDPQTCHTGAEGDRRNRRRGRPSYSQMTDQEALQNIAAIAKWVREEAPAARPDCGDVIQQLHRMTAGVDTEAALDLFSDVLGVLETSDMNVFGEGATSAL